MKNLKMLNADLKNIIQTQRTQIANELDELDYSLCQKDLSCFFDAAWPIVEPSRDLLWNWHHGLICEYLTACKLGQITRIIFNIPPRYAKSSLCTIMFPTWIWTEEPGKRFLFTSYSQSLSTKHSLDRRTIIKSPWYQLGWGDKATLAFDQNVKTAFQNTNRGHMIATSMGGTSTGKGGDYVIVDDPHNPKQAESDLQRETACKEFDRTFTNRLDDKKKGCLIIIMQRLHEADLTGHLLAQGGYEHVSVPAEAPSGVTVIFPITKKAFRREAGAILHPAREGEKEIKSRKKELGSYEYSGQYQQDPSPPEGGIVQVAWFKFYKKAPVLREQIITVDAAFKKKETSSYVCIQVWGREEPKRYLLDQVRRRMDFNETIIAFEAMVSKWPSVGAKIIEEAANGPAIIAALKKKIPGIIGVNAVDSKEARLRAVSPEIEAGDVEVPDPSECDWIGDYLEEFRKFPRGKNADQVDTTSMALQRFNDTSPMEVNLNFVSMEGASKWR